MLLNDDIEDIYKYFSRIKPLLYRQYRRLNEKEFSEVISLNMYPQEGFYTLLLYKKLGKSKSLKFCYKWVKKHWDDYYEWSSNKPQKHFRYNDNDILLEFQVRGFISSDKHKMRKGYCYILSNRLIERIQFIYPKRFSNNYNTMNKADYINNIFPRIAMEGFTKILY